MVRYEPQTIVEFAKHLYSRATTIIVIYTIVGVILGLVAGSLFGGTIGLLTTTGFGEYGYEREAPPIHPGAILGAIIFGVIGYLIGQGKALMLKFLAQLALCQVEIEENTRKAVGGGESDAKD